MARILHAATALICWASLVLQYVLLTREIGLGLGTWRFIGFFTILTNLMIATASTAAWLRPSSRLAMPLVRFAVLPSILVVGITYSLALRNTWSPQGLQKLADAGLHDVSPVLYLLAWLSAEHVGLAWRHLWWVIVPPVIYVAYSMARGAIDGWHPYWFLDPHVMTGGELTASIGLLLSCFLMTGALALLADRTLAARGQSGTANSV